MSASSSINDSGSRLSTLNKEFDRLTDICSENIVKTAGETLTILSSPSKCIKLGLANFFINGTCYGSLDHIKAIVYPGLIKADPAQLKDGMERLILNFKSNGLPIPDTANPERILESLCPKEEFMKQFAALNNWQSPWVCEIAAIPMTIITSVIAGPILEELIFRKGLQQVVLKDGVKKVIQKISPAHADLVDSKIYTVCRVVLTSICFGLLHYDNLQFASRELIDKQVYHAFFIGMFFGFLKETDGLSACFCAHMINNLVVALGVFSVRC